MDTLKYKGFIGSVEFSAEDEVFYGKIEGIKGLVNYEGESVKELKEAFHEAVPCMVGTTMHGSGWSPGRGCNPMLRTESAAWGP